MYSRNHVLGSNNCGTGNPAEASSSWPSARAGAVAAMKTINSVADCLAGVGAYAFGIIASSAMVTAPKEARTSRGCDRVVKQLVGD